jgi:hypothetical protein
MTPAGWYADHTDASLVRYWDGVAWTEHTARKSSQHVDLMADLRRVGNRVLVPATTISAGLAPERCVPHGRSGSPVQVSFVSKTPLWVYLTLFAALILPVIIALVIRKTVTAQAWPVCQQCRNERRQNLIWMWVSIGAWVPGFIFLTILPPGVMTLVFFFLILLGPLFVAVWFSGRANLGREIGGEVSADGVIVSFPDRVFPRPVAPAARSVSPEDPAAYFGR